VEGYHIIAENRKDPQNIVEKKLVEELPLHPVDYLRKALEVKWDDDDKIKKLEFKKLSETEVESISRTYQLQAAKMRAELYSDWMVLKTWTPSEGHTYYLAKAEIENAKQPFLQISYKTP
jgi:hypothetical protein